MWFLNFSYFDWSWMVDSNMPVTLTFVTLDCRMIRGGLEYLIQLSYATQNFIHLLEDFGVSVHIDSLGFTSHFF